MRYPTFGTQVHLGKMPYRAERVLIPIKVVPTRDAALQHASRA
jgi:hypothetical protein